MNTAWRYKVLSLTAALLTLASGGRAHAAPVSSDESGLGPMVVPGGERSGNVLVKVDKNGAVDTFGDDLYAFAPDKSASPKAQAKATSSGGDVYLSKHDAQDVVNHAVNMQNVHTATMAHNEAGAIVLDGSGAHSAATTVADKSDALENAKLQPAAGKPHRLQPTNE